MVCPQTATYMASTISAVSVHDAQLCAQADCRGVAFSKPTIVGRQRLSTALACMRILIAITLATFALPALAEVSDKAASQTQLWSQGAIVGGIALSLGLFRPLLGLVAGLPIALFFAVGAHVTLSDPHIGTALLAEQGEPYRTALYGSSALVALGACVGAAIGLRTRHLLGERRGAS